MLYKNFIIIIIIKVCFFIYLVDTNLSHACLVKSIKSVLYTSSSDVRFGFFVHLASVHSSVRHHNTKQVLLDGESGVSEVPLFADRQTRLNMICYNALCYAGSLAVTFVKRRVR